MKESKMYHRAVATVIHELFEAQVERTPDAVALSCEGDRLTYRELHERANHVAGLLLERGVGPDVLVGLYVERSLELIVGILGILKAGGAYVPLDSEYPKERLRFMIEDAHISALLTQKKLAGVLPFPRSQILCLDAFANCGAESVPHGTVEPHHLAYVIYTSGSTGKPKGVMVTHQNVVRLFQTTEALFHFNNRDVWTLFHSPAFDFSVWEIWGALLSGGRLVVVPYMTSRSPEGFYELLRTESVTVLNQTPSAFKQLLHCEACKNGLPSPALRYVIFGGEALHPHLLKPWFAPHGDMRPRMVNMYGITETTVHVTHRLLSLDDLEAGSVIGIPLPDLQVHLLDPMRQPVPPGSPGEMYVSGPGVARGYLNRPELTAERFIQDPMDADSQSQWYKTGDLARRLPCGELEYLGRIDQQVKIRGFRIELGEIEAAIARFDGVECAAVIAREDDSGDTRLVAYVVPHPGVQLSPVRLRAFLKEKLPPYMVPAAFVPLCTLPLNNNGKLDIRALPAPKRSDVAAHCEEIAPAVTSEEERIAAIWSEIFQISPIGPQDDFFEIGGHSLLATQVISRIRNAFGVDLSVRAIFEHPSVEKLAAQVRHALASGASIVPEAIPRIPPGTPPPLSFAQQRLWFLHRLEPGNAAYNLPTATLLNGPLDIPALERSLNEIIRRHSTLRASFPSANHTPVQILAPELALSLPVIDLSGLAPDAREAEVRLSAKEDAGHPFDLDAGPLLRASLLRLGESEHVLLLNVHHIVADGWSLTILFRELAANYEAFREGKPSPLPELPIQYADFAAWQRAALPCKTLAGQIAYWKQQLHEAPLFELPPDHPRPTAPSFCGAKQSLRLPRPLTEALSALGRRENATLFMTLLAAFKTLLFRWTRQADICIGTPVAGRNHVELERLIGFFNNTLVLRTDASGDPTFLELLAKVRETALGAFFHQDVPFEKLVEELNPDRSLGRTPLFNIFFNLLNYADEENAFSSLVARRLGSAETNAKFDLTLYAMEQDATIHLTAVYNAHIYRPERLVILLRQMEHLLCQIAENPAKKIAAYSLVTPEALPLLPDPTQPLQQSWEGAVQEQFDIQAARRADHPAVIDETGAWTFRALQSAANRLAQRLVSAGAQPGDLIAVYAHRSRSLVCALMGVLKAGAAFLILDPAYPPARLREYLRTANPRGFLQLEAAGPLPESLSEFVAAHSWKYRITLPQPGNAADEEFAPEFSNAPPAIATHPDALAYVAFTSGSTAEPKAISGSHRPLSHFLKWHAHTFGLGEGDRFSLLSGLSHDPLLRDIFTPLTLGATLVIPAADTLLAPDPLQAWLRSAGISVMHLTPALEQLLNEAAPCEDAPLSGLRYAFFGGEPLTGRHCASLRQRAPSVTCVNFYGATETPQAMGWHVVAPDSLEKGTVPVGRGISDAQLLVLNDVQELAGLGEPGEIYIRTPYLSQGYHNDDALTRARFPVNPFTQLPGDRLYRTGDLGRTRFDGVVEFLGRADRQMKIRGLRVEPGEIESLLVEHPVILEAHVRIHEGEKVQLVAYVVPREKNLPDLPAQLRFYLRERLPASMLPSAFLTLETLPLTPNGKVDARRLPPPCAASTPEKQIDSPTDTLEYQLQKIWEDVLKIAPVGIWENFFDLGGHSLLAARLFAQIQKVTGCNLPLAALFQAPTIGKLAALIRCGGWEPLWAALVPIQTQGKQPPLFLIHPVGGNVLGYHDLASYLDKEMPIFGLQALGLQGTHRPLETVEEMAAHYLKEIRTIRLHGPYMLVGYSSGGIVAFEMAQQLCRQGEHVPLLVLLDTAPSGSWKKPVLIRILGHARVLLQLSGRQKLVYALGKWTLAKQWTAQILSTLVHSKPGTAGSARPQVLEDVRMSNRQAVLQYRPAIYPGHLVLFRAKQRQDFFHEFQLEPDEGWKQVAGGGLTVRDIPGDHGQMLGNPNVIVLAQELQKLLNEVMPRV